MHELIELQQKRVELLCNAAVANPNPTIIACYRSAFERLERMRAIAGID